MSSPDPQQDREERARLGAALAGRYVIEREIGRGGMATVYLAHDVRHDRSVALKVLHPELAAALGPERFQREIRLAARLQHPHILTVHDSGEDAGRLWFTMPFVEGESLRDRLARERQLPVDDAVRIVRQAAQGLEYAHRHGVIHRDIKPENLLLTEDGNTLVGDFGIARSLTPGGEQLTATGLAVGTAAYMSPEQAAGERDLDARSDVYSLGCVLYELLAGETPFAAATPQATITRRFTEAPRPLRELRESVPEPVERAVRQALALTPADRFASAADFARALADAPTTSVRAAPAASPPAPSAARRNVVAAFARRPLFAMLLLGFALGLGVLFAWRRNESTAARDPDGQIRIAVLPFENVGNPADEYFADGITDEVRGKLSALPGMRVIAGASSREYKKSPKPLAQIGRELGVDYLLTARVQWAKTADGTSRVQVRPELVQLSSGAPTTRWEQPFDASLTDVFKVQADIAGQVARALDVALGDSTRRTLAAAPTANLQAYDAFLKGEAASQNMLANDPPSLRRATAYYERAVALDSTFLLAWTRLAVTRSLLYANSTPSPELAREAKDAVEHVQALGPGRPEVAFALGSYYRNIEDDNQRALEAAEAGLRVSPNDVALLANASVTEGAAGRWELALEHARRVHLLDPRSAAYTRRLAQYLLFLHHQAEARAMADSALALAPTNLLAIQLRTMTSLAGGDLADAREVVRTRGAAVAPAELLPYFANYWDLYWVLDDAQQRQLLALPVSSFDDDRAAWGIVRAQTYYLRGELDRARVYADSARLASEQQLRATPGDAQRVVFHGLALAYLGRKDQAVREGERGVSMLSSATNAITAAYLRHQLARIYALVGERRKAVEELKPLLAEPYYLSPGWLRIDPEFTALRGDPEFDRLAAGS